MKYFLLYHLLFYSCNFSFHKDPPFVTEPSGNYESLKNEISSTRVKLNSLYNDSSNKDSIITESRKYLEKTLINQLIPHWYGTTWDFNGHTNTPNNGEIACGYFVSTLLKHIGFNLNRYKMAQKGAYDEMKMLCSESEISNYPTSNMDELTSKLTQKYEEGVYMIGLDFHVGLILIKSNSIYFFHASYYEPAEVRWEIFQESHAIISSNRVWIAPLFSNKNLVKKWLTNQFLAH